ncbi:MAG TPA: DUF362 domain-containing protein [Armatimonadota bacterium]
MPYEVSIAACADYDDALVRFAVRDALAPLGGLERFVQPGQRVLIKLNLLSACAPERAVTTHPALVKAVVQLVQELGGLPVIGDSPGGLNTPTAYRAVLAETGMQAVIDETGCAVVNFDDEVVQINSAQARVFKQFTAVRAPLDADVVICLPKVKTHQFAYYTGAVKLLYGFLPGLTKAEYHLHAGRDIANFAELLLDIHDTLTPTLTIMDAVVGMEGNGPTHGAPKQIGLLLASTSCTALDYVMCEIIGLPPMRVPTVRAARERGGGPGTLEEITVHGEPLDHVRLPDFQQAEALTLAGGMPTWFADVSSWLFATRPIIDKRTCVHCGKCVKHCPPQAMTIKPGACPTIDDTPCLRCYCCQELCPVGAVRVGAPRVRFPVKLGDWLVPLLDRLRKIGRRGRK